MRLLALSLHGRYKGLKDQSFDFSRAQDNIFALIGLNGSGKSQLLELIGETFAYLERWQRPDFKTKSPLGFAVNIYYQWDLRNDPNILSYHDAFVSAGDKIELRVSIEERGNVIVALKLNGEWSDLEGERLFPLPIVVGYASGLNENLQRSFMKNAVQHYEVRRISSKKQKELAGKIDDVQRAEINQSYASKHPHIFSRTSGEAFDQGGYLDVVEVNSPASNLIYLDYDNAGLLIACLAILPSASVRNLLDEVTFKHPARAVLRYDFRSGVIEEDAIRDVQMLIRIAGEGSFTPMGKRTTDQQYDVYDLDYLAGQIELDLTDADLLDRLRETNYNDPMALFRRLYKLQQLGVKNWPYTLRQQLLQDRFLGTVKKPLKTKLPLSVVKLMLADNHEQKVNFDDLSDGEAQLTQVLAAARIFGKAQTLFLFDEPETHLNPSWRTYFHRHLVKALEHQDGDMGQCQVFLSTHSPFMISSLKRQNVFFFARDDNGWISMEPVASQTYGASFDVLIKNYYGLRSLISQTVVEEVKQHLPTNKDPEAIADSLRWIEENLGESMEKAYLLRKLQS